jgi:Xaa-Pro aminopeptidase
MQSIIEAAFPPAPTKSGSAIPFDTSLLDSLLDKAGIDVLLVTSKHNVQYLLGGYRFFFFEFMDAIGLSRYLPIVVYARGRPDRAAYFGNAMEAYENENRGFWTPHVYTKFWGSTDSMAAAIDHVKTFGNVRRIGVEMAFLPADAASALRREMTNCDIVDAIRPLERLRACKGPEELHFLKAASNGVVDSMLAVFATQGPGASKQDLVDKLRTEEQKRGLNFDYCLITAGTSHNRAPSLQLLQQGDIVSLDSGANYFGYIGDLCRMGILGEPDNELVDLLGFVETVQQAARRPIQAGNRGGEIFVEAAKILAASPHKPYTHFVAHGMGIISHEAPRLTSSGNVPYPGDDADLPLQSGMVLSIETTMAHRRGYIKLEDTLAVTDTGFEALGDRGRGWNIFGKTLSPQS